MRLENAIGQKLLWSFHGKLALPVELLNEIGARRVGGVSLFRDANIDSPAQVRELAALLQRSAERRSRSRLLIGVDQEGGQLAAIGGGATELPGNMALGATGSVDLARRAGALLGRELAAMGVNLVYAPCCDVNLNPNNPVIGVRSFGEDPSQVARLVACMVEGIQSWGVAATAKHFPGHGDTATDSHHGIPVVPHQLDRLRSIEFPPFMAAIQAGAKVVMTSHLALPVLDGRHDLPATLSRKVQQDLLRGELGFTGVIVSDALDMKAVRKGRAPGEETVLAVEAGIDLLLMKDKLEDQARVFERLVTAAQMGRLSRQAIFESARRVLALKAWLASWTDQPDLDVVGCQEHQEVALDIAARSITLVRDESRLLPLNMEDTQRIAVILPKPQDLTPADTSSYLTLTLAAEMRKFHPKVDEYIVEHAPGHDEIAAILDRVRGYDVLLLGTLNAYAQPEQAELARAVLRTGLPVIVVAMRLPYDLAVFPKAGVFLCTYSLQSPSMQTLAQALFGKLPFQGRLPVSIPGLYACGHGLRL